MLIIMSKTYASLKSHLDPSVPHKNYLDLKFKVPQTAFSFSFNNPLTAKATSTLKFKGVDLTQEINNKNQYSVSLLSKTKLNDSKIKLKTNSKVGRSCKSSINLSVDSKSLKYKLGLSNSGVRLDASVGKHTVLALESAYNWSGLEFINIGTWFASNGFLIGLMHETVFKKQKSRVLLGLKFQNFTLQVQKADKVTAKAGISCKLNNGVSFKACFSTLKELSYTLKCQITPCFQVHTHSKLKSSGSAGFGISCVFGFN